MESFSIQLEVHLTSSTFVRNKFFRERIIRDVAANFRDVTFLVPRLCQSGVTSSRTLVVTSSVTSSVTQLHQSLEAKLFSSCYAHGIHNFTQQFSFGETTREKRLFCKL
jgi:hypothetical protein